MIRLSALVWINLNLTLVISSIESFLMQIIVYWWLKSDHSQHVHAVIVSNQSVNSECCTSLTIEVFELMEWRKNIVINYIETIWWCFIECHCYSGGSPIILHIIRQLYWSVCPCLVRAINRYFMIHLQPKHTVHIIVHESKVNPITLSIDTISWWARGWSLSRECLQQLTGQNLGVGPS